MDRLLIVLGPATRTVPGDRDSVMILRRGVVSEVRPILDEERLPALDAEQQERARE